MKKILVAIDSTDLKTSVVDFACYLARLTNSKLTGLFLQEGELEEIQMASPADSKTSDRSGLEQEQRKEFFPKSVLLFREICSNRGVNCDAYVDGEMPVEDIIAETRYADIVIVDPTTSFADKPEGIPTHFLKELLSKTECPVIVAPESFDWINEIVFAYDGSSSSVYAMKQFTYLFPELHNRKVFVIQVCDGDDHQIIDKEKIASWLKNYYTQVNYLVLIGRPKDELFGYLIEKDRMMVVMGAFGRSMISSLFSRSSSELLLKAVNLPIFISHK